MAGRGPLVKSEIYFLRTALPLDEDPELERLPEDRELPPEER